MYGKVLGVSAPTTGIALLPSTGNNRVLFVLASSLIAAGVIILVASTIMARKARQSAAN